MLRRPNRPAPGTARTTRPGTVRTPSPGTGRTSARPTDRHGRSARPRRAGGKVKTFGSVGGVVAVLFLTFGLRLCNKSGDDSRIKGEMLAVLHDIPNYPARSSDYQRMLDRFHHEAFEQAYSLGSRRMGSSFDDKRYIHLICARMAEDASSRGDSESANYVRALEVLYHNDDG